MSNQQKRTNKFNRELSLLKTHPNFNDVKQLYVNNIIKNIASAEKKLLSIKLTNKGQVYKTSLSKQQELIKQVKELNKPKVQKKEPLFNKQFVIDKNVYEIMDGATIEGMKYVHTKIKQLINQFKKQKYMLNIEVKYYNDQNELLFTQNIDYNSDND